MGNVLKDVYLNLDERTNHFETDKNGVNWLDLSFDASEHHFFHRSETFGGAAVSLEVLQNLGISATVPNFPLHFSPQASSASVSSEDPLKTSDYSFRYLLIANGQVSYLSPSAFLKTNFFPPQTSFDYLYIDRSATISSTVAQKILAYLKSNPRTKLITYVRDLSHPGLDQLLSSSSLIFLEKPSQPSSFSTSSAAKVLRKIPASKIISLSERQFSYLNLSEPISPHRLDLFTHLSFYSIAAATILGCFVLGYSVEDSLKFARLNVEHSKLNASLSLAKLKTLSTPKTSNLSLLAANLLRPPKGILAADESGGSIKKKFASLDIPDTAENRRAYRDIFLSAPNLPDYVNGVILFEETAHQSSSSGQNFVELLTSKQIIPGIKVDQGLKPLENSPNSQETYTSGLDGLASRLQEYYNLGLRFTKWRSAFTLTFDEKGNILTPSQSAIEKNCRDLAKYAKICQNCHFVPIVEPELVHDGNYSLNDCALATSRILDCLFAKLAEARVDLSACILKVNMILAGKQFKTPSTPEEIGIATAKVLKRHVPKELAGVVFLSGGQTPEQATDNLSAIEKNGPFPWPVTFSFARALQDPALYTWAGNPQKANSARLAFEERLKANQAALKPLQSTVRKND